jgi:hypothetical protein
MRQPARILIGFVMFALGAPALVAAQEGQDQEAMMKAYMETAAPGEAHAKLAEMAGDWNFVMRSYEDPEHPMEVQGTAKMAMILGGRYLKEETSGMMMGAPFNGVGITGYNNVTKEYESVWYDNMGTGIMKSVGKGDGDVITMYSEYVDPMTQKKMNVKTVSERMGKDKATFTWYALDGDKETKSFEIEYTRKQ